MWFMYSTEQQHPITKASLCSQCPELVVNLQIVSWCNNNFLYSNKQEGPDKSKQQDAKTTVWLLVF